MPYRKIPRTTIAPKTKQARMLMQIADRVAIDDECWLWTGRLNPNGYPRVDIDNRAGYAHRVMYELMNGPIPRGLELDHLCRTPACVRPDHLEPVTHSENMLRSPFTPYRRAASEWQAAKTHCPSGHEYTPENTYIAHNGRGWRTCKTCKSERAKARYAARRSEVAA